MCRLRLRAAPVFAQHRCSRSTQIFFANNTSESTVSASSASHTSSSFLDSAHADANGASGSGCVAMAHSVGRSSARSGANSSYSISFYYQLK